MLVFSGVVVTSHNEKGIQMSSYFGSLREPQITVERVRHSGALVISALVTDGTSVFVRSETFYGYRLPEAREKFFDNLADKCFILA